MSQGRAAPTGPYRYVFQQDPAWQLDEPATELMEMPRDAPLAYVELGVDDLEPWDDDPSTRAVLPRVVPPRKPRASGARNVPAAITEPIPETTVPLPEPSEPPVPPPLPVLFGARPPPARSPRGHRRAAPEGSRQRWLASAVSLAAAWGVILLLGVCLALAVLARSAV
jgi:hypothetical protein